MITRRLFSSISSKSFKLPPTVKDLLASPTSVDAPTITVSGWIKSVRRQKNVTFAVITDGSSPRGLQAVFVGKAESVNSLMNGAAVQLSGRLVPSIGAGQDKELLVDLGKSNPSGESNERIQILGSCDPEVYPIQKQTLTTEYLRDHSHLRARTDTIASMIRLRDSLKRSINRFFHDQGFVYTHTPILTGNDAEGAGEAFRIAEVNGNHPAANSDPTRPTNDSQHKNEFFSRPAHLTVSHQLHLEALATSISRVYTLSPCFRAERSQTGRHLAEFWMLEAEWAFGGQRVDETCSFVEACLRSVVGDAVRADNNDLDVLWKGGDETKRRALLDAVESAGSWTRMSYTDAIKALQEYQRTTPGGTFSYQPEWGKPLQSEHERWIAETLVGGPVFIIDYPAVFKPFYMRQNLDEKTVGCFDLIVPHVGELVGGSVREERAEVLEGKMRKNFGDDLAAYQWYLDLRKYGGAPHMGFGMGFERLVGWVGGIENIKESIPFPRWANRMLL